MEIKQYQIVLVNLDPTIGSEIRKTRPCVVISPDEMNRHLRTVIIAPLTATSKSYPSRVKVKHKKKYSFIVLDQIRTIDRRRIQKHVGELAFKEIEDVKEVIQEMLVS